MVTTTMRRCLNGLDPDAAARPPKDEMFFGVDFVNAPDLEEIGGSLIRADGSGLEDVLRAEARVKYVWKRKASKSGASVIGGKCQKVSGLSKHFADCDYVVWLAADYVRERGFNNWQLEALVYHELNHIVIEDDDEGGEPKLSVQSGHDVAFFLDEIGRYGLWKDDIEAAADSFAQAPMF